jgi:hypothetical protein
MPQALLSRPFWHRLSAAQHPAQLVGPHGGGFTQECDAGSQRLGAPASGDVLQIWQACAPLPHAKLLVPSKHVTPPLQQPSAQFWRLQFGPVRAHARN